MCELASKLGNSSIYSATTVRNELRALVDFDKLLPPYCASHDFLPFLNFPVAVPWKMFASGKKTLNLSSRSKVICDVVFRNCKNQADPCAGRNKDEGSTVA